MLGSELVSLTPASSRRRLYNRIWQRLIDEPGYRSRFGIALGPVTKAAALDRLWNRGDVRIHKLLVRLGNAAFIGVAYIEEDRRNGACFIAMGLLPEFRGRRLGSVTARLLLRKSFAELNARRVESSALSSNPASITMQDGMILEGTLKGRFIIDGREVDELLFRLLRSEWESQQQTKTYHLERSLP